MPAFKGAVLHDRQIARHQKSGFPFKDRLQGPVKPRRAAVQHQSPDMAFRPEALKALYQGGEA